MTTAIATSSRPTGRARKNTTAAKKQSGSTAAGTGRGSALPVHQPKTIKDTAAHRRKLAVRKQPGAHVPFSDLD
jgi:hypothetical protein